MLLISAFSPQRLSLCGIEVRLPAAHFVPVRGSYYRSGLHRQLKPQAPDPHPGFILLVPVEQASLWSLVRDESLFLLARNGLNRAESSLVSMQGNLLGALDEIDDALDG